MVSAAPIIGIIGFGEVGSSFARGWLDAGLRVLAHDRPQHAAQHRLAQDRAALLGLAVPDRPDILGGCDWVFSCVPQDQAEAAAAAAAVLPHLRADAVYIDVNSLGPAAKRALADQAAAHGRAFIDGAIMSIPSADLHRAVILAAGPGADAFAVQAAGLGMRVTAVGDTPGAAAAIKILRSGVVKGLECLLAESLTAARRLGVDAAVLASLHGLLGPQAAPILDFLIRSHGVHARRRALEVAMGAATLAEAGIDPVVTAAVAERLRRTAAGPLTAAAIAAPPADAAQAIDQFDLYL